MQYSIVNCSHYACNSYKLKEGGGEHAVFNNYLKKLDIAKHYWSSIASLYVKGMNTELEENQAY